MYLHAFNNEHAQNVLMHWKKDIVYDIQDDQCLDNFYKNNFKRYVIEQATDGEIEISNEDFKDLPEIDYKAAFDTKDGRYLLKIWQVNMLGRYVEFNNQKILRCNHPSPERLLIKEDFVKNIIRSVYE